MKLIGRRSGEAPMLAVGILSLLVISALTGLAPIARGASPSPSTQSGTKGAAPSISPATVRTLSASGSKPASDPTVASSVSAGATGFSPERKVFYSSGYWWVFWDNLGGFYYSSSLNGTFWSTPIEFSSGTSFSVWVAQGTDTVYYAASTGSAEFYYNTGTLNSPVDGQIAWGTKTTVSTVYDTEGSISVIIDSLGNPWVAAYTINGETPEQYVEIYEMVGGTWGAASNSPIANPPPSSPVLTDGRVQLVPIPNGVSVLYSFIDCNPYVYSDCYTGLSLEYATLSGGTLTWSSPVGAGADYTEFSATALGDTIYIAGSYGPGGVDFSYYTIGDTAASTPVTLASGRSWSNDAGTQVSISQGAPGSETLVLFYQEGEVNIGYLVGAIAPDKSVTWGTAQSVFPGDQTILYGISSVDTAPITPVGDDFGLIFTNYVEIYNLDFASVTTPSITLSPTQGPVGTVVTVKGAAFSASTDIGSIEFDGATPAAQTCTAQETDVTGAFTCTFTVPADTAGEYTVTVAGSDIATVSGDAASATFTVTTPTITLSPLVGLVGTIVTVMGTGFSVQTDIGSITITDGTITTTDCVGLETNSTGGFICSFTVPSDDTAGAQTVTVTGSDGGADTAFNTFTVSTSVSSSLVQLSITLNQFDDYGSSLSASNYFTVDYYASGTPTSANHVGGTITLLVDPNKDVNISAVSSASNTVEQWCLSATSDGTCQKTVIPVGTSDLSVTYVYYDLQVQFVNYEITGGGDPVAPLFGLYATAPLSPLSYGAPNSVTVNPLSGSYATIWVIAGTLENFQPTANTSPPADFQQWQGAPDCDVLFVGSISCGALVSSNSVGPFSQGGVFVTIDYYHQYEELPQYQITPGSDQGTGYTGPTLKYYSAGVLSKQLLTLESPVEVWVDAGTGWSVNSTLGGSWASEQWICISDCSGTVPGAELPLDISPTYSHQYLVVFNAALYFGCSGSGYPPISSLNFCMELGQPTDLWVPAGQPYTLNAVVYVGTALIGWTSCASWSAMNELPGDSGCPPSEVTIPSGLGNEVGNGWQTQITANGPGTVVYADYVFQVTGSTATCTGGPANCQYFHESYGTEGIGDPVYVLVTGPYGTGQVGCNDTGGAVETMALASVSSCGGSTELIVIANPIKLGQYEVDVFPDGGTGAYNITMTTEGPDGNVTGTPLFTSGTCTVSGGCTPFNVTVGADGVLSFSATTVPTGVPQFAGSILVLVPVLLLALVYLRRRSWPKSG